MTRLNIVSAAMVALTVCLAGCDQGRNELDTVPVSGKVMFNKTEPAAGATIVFHPINRDFETEIGGKPFATVNDDGSFTVMTYHEGDGAPPGEYGITVEWQVADKKSKPKLSLSNEGPGAMKSKLKPKYGNPQQPFMNVTIPKGGKTDILVEVD